MIETILVMLVATGGLVFMANQWQRGQGRLPAPNDIAGKVVSTIAEGGLYSIYKIGDAPQLSAFADLHLVQGGIVWRDALTGLQQMLGFSHLQWVSAVHVSAEGIATIHLHTELNAQWRIVTLQLPQTDMGMLVKVLRQVVSPSRTNIGRQPAHPIGPIAARLLEENLQGETNVGAEVSLYLLPHLLVVLHGNTVQAKLDTSSIRRVLAVERVSGKLDLLNNAPEGIVRLYSLRETAVFALPQYRELAEEISYLARCPIEFITQNEKTDKA